MKTRRITYAYLLILLAGSVVPMGRDSSVLSDNYVLHIRWDYLLHALAYIPLPVLLGMSLGKGTLKFDLQAGSVKSVLKPESREPDRQAGSRQSESRQPESRQSHQKPLDRTLFWFLLVLFSLLITALLEGFQLFIPYRFFNINDMLANGVGTAIGFMLIPIFRDKKLVIL